MFLLVLVTLGTVVLCVGLVVNTTLLVEDKIGAYNNSSSLIQSDPIDRFLTQSKTDNRRRRRPSSPYSFDEPSLFTLKNEQQKGGRNDPLDWLEQLLLKNYNDADDYERQHRGKATCQGQAKQLESYPNCHCRALRPKSRGCCVRQFLHNHKHGSWLAESILGEALFDEREDGREPLVDASSTSRLIELRQEHAYKTGDYRTVVMLRNWYDALLSGYLYHKDGRECWKTPSGDNITSTSEGRIATTMTAMDPFMQKGWINFVPSFIVGDASSMSNNNNRSLCEYLAKEPLGVGLRTYLHVAMNRWHLPLLRLYQVRQDDCNRTMYVCYPDLLEEGNMDRRNTTTMRLLDHWFPNLVDGQPNKKRPIVVVANKDTTKGGGHATTKDIPLRLELLREIRRLDKMDWNFTIAKGNALFGCEGDLESQVER